MDTLDRDSHDAITALIDERTHSMVDIGGAADKAKDKAKDNPEKVDQAKDKAKDTLDGQDNDQK